MRKRTWARLVPIVAALALAATGCGDSGGSGGGGGGGGNRQVTGLEILVGTAPGSGYDLTARAAAKAMEDAKLAGNVEVFNPPAPAAPSACSGWSTRRATAGPAMQMGLGVVGAVYTNKSEATLDQTTPIARLIEEPEAIVVPKGSPYKTLDELVAAWKADPGKVPVGGGSTPGGPDHLTPMLLAKAVGVDPKQVNYVAYDGGGELLAGRPRQQGRPSAPPASARSPSRPRPASPGRSP